MEPHDIRTGDPVPDASYTFRLATTMLSSKIYAAYHTHDVNRADALAEGELPPDDPGTATETAKFTVPPNLGPYEKYLDFQADDQGRINLTVTLPDASALEGLADSLARLLGLSR